MGVAYFSQFETPDVINAYMRDGPDAALRTDALWAGSGAADIDEYARWAGHVCGMACLKMILSARGKTDFGTIELARRCREHGGYIEDDESGMIRGLIYAPFIDWICKAFAISARVATDIGVADLPEIVKPNGMFMASVHPFIRTLDAPPHRGGHLVLVTQATAEAVVFHNPSGHTRDTRENVRLAPEVFGRYFAGRGIAILP